MNGLRGPMKVGLWLVIVVAAMLSGPGEAAAQPEDPPQAQQLNQQVLELHRQGQYGQALPLAQQALALREAALGPEHALVGESLNNLASLYKAIGRDEQSVPLYQRALAIAVSQLNPDDPSVIAAMTRLASALDEVDDPQALPLLQKALSATERVYGPQSIAVGARLFDLALVHFARARFDEAVPLFQRALAIAEKNDGPQHRTTAGRLMGLSRVYKEVGKYDPALAMGQRAFAIYRKVLGDSDPTTTAAAVNLAEIYRVIGVYDRSLPIQLRALDETIKSDGIESLATLARLNNLASLYVEMGRSEKALETARRALDIYENLGQPETKETLGLFNTLAVIHEGLGNHDFSLGLTQAALRISNKLNGPNHPSTATITHNIGKTQEAMGHPELALPMYHRALLIADASGDRALSWVIRGNLMDLHRSAWPSAPEFHQPALAIWFGKQAVNTLQVLRSDMSNMRGSVQNSFLARNRWTYQRLANLLIETGRIAEAEQVLGMLKERELFELTRSNGAEPSRRQADFVGQERQALGEYRRLASLAVKDANELAGLEKRINAGDRLSASEQSRCQSLLKAAETWRAEYQRFLSGLGQFFAEAARRPVTREADIQVTRLQAQVAQDRDGAVGLHYVVADDRIGIIVATAQASFGRFSDIKRKALTDQIVALRQALLARADTRPAAQALWKMLIEPVQADLQAAGAKTLVLSLTDELRYLPFAALQNPAGRYLIEDHALALWAAAADTKAAPSNAPWRVSALGLTQARAGFSALPGVRQELSGIVRTQDGGVPTTGGNGVLPGSITLDEHFGRSEFETALGGRNNVVHVASHFDFRPGDESRSVLLMGQGEPLSLGQLAVMNFQRVEQLTLSACDTATGGGINENGAEVEGLAAVVLRQRAQAVLATLWKVADASTAQLMHDFYAVRGEQLPLGRAQALRQAQLAMLRGATAKPNATTTAEQRRSWSHPFYWAPFVLSGNWL